MTPRRLLAPVLSLLLAFALFGCETTTTHVPDYADFNYLEDYDEVFTRREGTYLVYVYSPTCTSCEAIKEDVLAFAGSYDDRVLFFFDAAAATAALQADFLAAVGRDELNTPTLILVADNEFDPDVASRFYFEGGSAILAVLNDLENGSYPYWN